MNKDGRISWDLIIDVLSVLERHGYHGCDSLHTGQAIGVIGDLAQVYEGARDAPYGTYLTPAPPPEPGPPVPEADQDAVILTGTDVGTVVAALDLAADCKLGHAETCADCADQSCLTCQSRLQDAQAHDQLAAQILHTAGTARPAHASQPEPASPDILPGQADPDAGKEAGQ